MPVPSQKGEQSCIYVLNVSILPLSAIVVLNFGTVRIVKNFFFILLLTKYKKNCGSVPKISQRDIQENNIAKIIKRSLVLSDRTDKYSGGKIK